MLKFEIRKCNGGFIFWGDYGSLKPLHSLIMGLTEYSISLDAEGLARDVKSSYFM